MSTQIELSDQEIAELKEVTAQSELPLAIRTALTEYIRYVQRMRLKELSGKVEMQDNGRNLRRGN